MKIESLWLCFNFRWLVVCHHFRCNRFNFSSESLLDVPRQESFPYNNKFKSHSNWMSIEMSMVYPNWLYLRLNLSLFFSSELRLNFSAIIRPSHFFTSTFYFTHTSLALPLLSLSRLYMYCDRLQSTFFLVRV